MKIANLNYSQNHINTFKFAKNDELKTVQNQNLKDVVEISKEAKEILKISNSKTSHNSSSIYFEDSAAVLRAIDRGYVTVDGKNIRLSDEDKKNLLQMDKIAQEKRLSTFYKRHLEHEVAVFKQQNAAWDLYFKQLLYDIDIFNTNDKHIQDIMKIASKGVDGNDFEWKGYEGGMNVSNGVVSDIFMSEKIIVKGEN